MTYTTETSSDMLIRIAQADAQRNVSKWGWRTLGVGLSILPAINVVALGIAILIMYLLIPNMDLSSPEKVRVYSRHPSLYTEQFRKTSKMLRSMNVLCGWTIGIILKIYLNLF